jgi:MFS family permease
LTKNRNHGLYYGYVIVIASFFIIMIILGTFYSFGVFFKSFLDEFGWNRATTSAAFSWSFVVMGFFGVITGKLNDRFGPRLVVTIGGICYGVGFFLMRWISQVWQFYLLYGVVIAIGMSCAMMPLIATPPRWFVKRRGLMTGIVVAGSGVGSMLTPLLANWLVSTYSWRASYTVIGIAALVITVVAAQFLRRDPAQMGLKPYGVTEISSRSASLNLGGFSLRESIRTRQFWILCVVNFCFNFCLQIVLVHIVAHAIDQGVGEAAAAIIITIVGGVSIAGRLVTGSAIDQIGSRRAILMSLFFMLAAYVWLLFAGAVPAFYIFAIIFGFAYGGLVTVLTPAVAELFGVTALSLIAASISFVSCVGSLGSIVAGSIFDATGSYTLSFLFAIGLSVIGLIVTIFLRPLAPKETR